MQKIEWKQNKKQHKLYWCGLVLNLKKKKYTVYES